MFRRGRFSALALLVMALVIQLFAYLAAYPTHGLWAALLLYLMARGPGALSLDPALNRLLGAPKDVASIVGPRARS